MYKAHWILSPLFINHLSRLTPLCTTVLINNAGKRIKTI